MTYYNHGELLALIQHVGVTKEGGDLGLGWQIEQNPNELANFLFFCQPMVTSMLELGTGETGGFARLCSEYLGWQVTSIDHRRPKMRSGEFICGETDNPAVYAQVKDRRFDLVFIDADHHYESVIHDHAWYAPLAAQVVAIHDIAPGREGTQGVCCFWNELEVVGMKQSTIDDQHPIGLGWYTVHE